MTPLPIRLQPGQDLRLALQALLPQHGAAAAYVLQGIGSLSVAQLRFAGAGKPTELRGDLEILSLAGSLSADGPHLHMAVADARGQVSGGHVAAGCMVRTTAELLVLLLPEHQFNRAQDTTTGYAELAIRPRQRDMGK
ncbi:PPC domain-containing DNA-binding protein [Undibacterium sp.]|uniref:PPC domain-containing DNA-binding protein n=1 Tax=Undibacterium sp. TaxID=1914977 RepID=UPI002C037D02|nr:PPC domain-containing DNA-binding protein [Undibacterium sp.]HTD03862.1 PPC domain-containing DNA-binding protein [Undibacterium sp.]